MPLALCCVNSGKAVTSRVPSKIDEFLCLDTHGKQQGTLNLTQLLASTGCASECTLLPFCNLVSQVLQVKGLARLKKTKTPGSLVL